jgi:hypothetical protein
MNKLDLCKLRKAMRPFVDAKIHNPNKSSKKHTSRVLNVRQKDIDALCDMFTVVDDAIRDIER